MDLCSQVTVKVPSSERDGRSGLDSIHMEPRSPAQYADVRGVTPAEDSMADLTWPTWLSQQPVPMGGRFVGGLIMAGIADLVYGWNPAAVGPSLGHAAMVGVAAGIGAMVGHAYVHAHQDRQEISKAEKGREDAERAAAMRERQWAEELERLEAERKQHEQKVARDRDYLIDRQKALTNQVNFLVKAIEAKGATVGPGSDDGTRNINWAVLVGKLSE